MSVIKFWNFGTFADFRQDRAIDKHLTAELLKGHLAIQPWDTLIPSLKREEFENATPTRIHSAPAGSRVFGTLLPFCDLGVAAR